MLLTPRAPSTAAEGALRRLLFPPYWRVLRVEPLLDDLLDLPSGNIEFAGNRGPDHRDVAILPGGEEFYGTGLVSCRRGGEDAGHLVGASTSRLISGLLTGASSVVCYGGSRGRPRGATSPGRCYSRYRATERRPCCRGTGRRGWRVLSLPHR